jgi:hypothetical protein
LSQGLQKLPELTTFIPTSNPSRTLRLTWNFKLPMLLLFAFQLKNVHLKKVAAAGVQRIGDLSVAPCSLLTVQNRSFGSGAFSSREPEATASSHRKNAGFSLCVVDPH